MPPGYAKWLKEMLALPNLPDQPLSPDPEFRSEGTGWNSDKVELYLGKQTCIRGDQWAVPRQEQSAP